MKLKNSRQKSTAKLARTGLSALQTGDSQMLPIPYGFIWIAGFCLGADGNDHFVAFLGVEKLLRLLRGHLAGGVGLLRFLFGILL